MLREGRLCRLTVEGIEMLTEDDFLTITSVADRSKQSQRSKEEEDEKKPTHSIMIIIAENRLSDATPAKERAIK